MTTINRTLSSTHINTPLGTMLAIADEHALYLLEFTDRKGLAGEIERLTKAIGLAITPGHTAPLESIESELRQYFAGELKQFTTPIILLGTQFQRQVWQELQKIPSGTTRSYLHMAHAIANPKGQRAVAQANSCNQLAIIVPCHRVINANGMLGGYSAGIERKQWLLEHEKGFTR